MNEENKSEIIEKQETSNEVEQKEERGLEEEPMNEMPPLSKPIFNPLLRKNQINERFNMSPQEYLGTIN